jgi:predicted kinase
MNAIQLNSTKQTVYITKGIPGAGKTFWSKQMLVTAHNLNVPMVRVNNDDIRIELFGEEFEWTPDKEKKVRTLRMERIEQAIRNKSWVIIDNTHINRKTLNSLKEWLKQKFPNVVVEEVDFTDVPVHTCIDRDMERQQRGERFVGAQVILKMAHEAGLEEEEVKNPIDKSLPWCIISDLDGTLALFGNRRNPYDASNCHLVDEPNLAVKQVISTYEEVYKNKGGCYSDLTAMPDVKKVFFFSGRTDKFRSQTEQFLLEKCDFDTLVDPFFELVMRKEGDRTADEIIKEDMYNLHIKGKYNVAFVMDDRPRVCRAWRRLGLPVFNVGSGREF